MKTLLAFVVCAVLGQVAVSGASPGDPAGVCGSSARAKVLASSPRGELRTINRVVGLDVFACARGHERAFGISTCTSDTCAVDAVAAYGCWFVARVGGSDRYGHSSASAIHRANICKRRKQRIDSALWIPDLESIGHVAVVTRRGAMAWTSITYRPLPDGSSELAGIELWKLDAGGRVLVASSTGIDPSSLAVGFTGDSSDSYLYWAQNGAPQSERLVAPRSDPQGNRSPP